MKIILQVVIIAMLFSACKSSSKQLERGDYDAAIQKSARKIKRNPGKNFDEAFVFNDA
jgi:PBP1b-binding outer membrane lipoprotein LpoB